MMLQAARSSRILSRARPVSCARMQAARSFFSSSSRNPFGSKKGRPLVLAIVPQQEAWVVERFGKLNRVFEGGLHFMLPFVDQVSYQFQLKEVAIPVSSQSAITQDNVRIEIDGVLYVKIIDPIKASYGVSDLHYAMVQLAQTTMRSELGKMTLDRTFAEREALNNAIVATINSASEEAWGVRCLRYEIRDITPPPAVQEAMELQVAAERRKRARILDSEGIRQAEINTADGQKQSVMLAAQGEAEATVARAKAIALGVETVALALEGQGGSKAASLRLAEQYIEAFGRLAQKSTTMLLPSQAGDTSAMVTFLANPAQVRSPFVSNVDLGGLATHFNLRADAVATAMSIFNQLNNQQQAKSGLSGDAAGDFSLDKALEQLQDKSESKM